YGSNLLWMSLAYARADRRREGHVPDPDFVPQATPVSVTIQLPLYNEPLVAERLIDACARIDHPPRHLEIQVLDDSTDSTSNVVTARVAAWQRRGINIVHVRRPHRDGFKAGALQNGFRIARGDYIAIFDADFVPKPDFLRRILAEFTDDDIGLVQSRWSHLNSDSSILTKMQAMGLDTHFAIEQRVRELTGCFITFNGTAGVWRRECIEDAGGWQGDTIAEDLDLSYRAQMKGWRFRYVGDLEVPAELPASTSALRSQQFRWAKGSTETALKLLGPLWRSAHPLRVKLQGTIHMTAHAAFLFILLALFLHAPLLVAKSVGEGPGPAYFGWMALGLAGFVGFSLAQLYAQRDLYVDWGRRLRLFPAFMAGSIGLSLSNARAVLEALAGKRSAFVRTPKFNAEEISSRSSTPPIAYAELAIFVYSLAGLAAVVSIGEWAAIPFQALFVAGFGIITIANFAPSLLKSKSGGASLADNAGRVLTP
ncbi:MAG: glycosyltransferase, partial [Rhodothermales bacterium]